ncbi:double-stranded RNA-specific adenosine deaminase [Amia ocellicauda]|uniref:double-stranded RNA-specific adenosine deaminase n=1 Tax=Amia ocellicauda TaxID=2972642 RepID=UPI0034646A60
MSAGEREVALRGGGRSGKGEGYLAERVCAFLREKERENRADRERAGEWAGCSALQIAAGLGLRYPRQVNPTLYALERRGTLYRRDAVPPLWSLRPPRAPQHRRGETSPGQGSIVTQQAQPPLSAPSLLGALPAFQLAQELGVPLFASFRCVILRQGARCGPQEVLCVLGALEPGATMSAAQVARTLRVPKRTANQLLYWLLRQGRVRIEPGTPPWWSLL